MLDSVLAGLLAIAGVVTLSAEPTATIRGPPTSGVPARARRVRGAGRTAGVPITVLAVVTAAAGVYVVRQYVENGLPVIVLIALYAVASITPRRQWGSVVAALSVLLLTLTLVGGGDVSAADLAGNIAIFLIAAVFGTASGPDGRTPPSSSCGPSTSSRTRRRRPSGRWPRSGSASPGSCAMSSPTP